MIGVQNLIKKNQALISEINNHEPQVASVVEQGDGVKEGKIENLAIYQSHVSRTLVL